MRRGHRAPSRTERILPSIKALVLGRSRLGEEVRETLAERSAHQVLSVEWSPLRPQPHLYGEFLTPGPQNITGSETGSLK